MIYSSFDLKLIKSGMRLYQILVVPLINICSLCASYGMIKFVLCQKVNNHLIYSNIAGLPLCDLSPTLRNELIKRLDVCHKGEYGWKKLGDAFKVEEVDLKYLETAYLQRPVGSPTEELLKILETKCIIVGEVLNKLQGSYVNRPDVAQLICQKWQDNQDTK